MQNRRFVFLPISAWRFRRIQIFRPVIARGRIIWLKRTFPYFSHTLVFFKTATLCVFLVANLFFICETALAQSVTTTNAPQPPAALPAGPAPTVGVLKNDKVDDPAEPLKDSLSERGSHNFSDMGSWIWDTNTFDRQTVRFWKTFEIPAGTSVMRARLRITADNEYILYLDGHELGRDAEWRHLYEYDATALLEPGNHVLAVEVYNSSREAGFLLGMQVGLSSGQVVKIKSDASWSIVPLEVNDWMNVTEPDPTWRNAVVEAAFGFGPWGTMDYIDLVPPLEPTYIPFWKTGWFEVLLLSICGVISLISVSLAMQVLLHQKEQQLIQRERARIARDIHDDLGTRVTQLVLQGEVAKNDLPAGSKARGQLDRISDEAREALRAMDEILWAINPRRDTLHEFATFVCGHAQTFLRATSIQCVLDVEPGMSTVAFDLPFRRNLLLAVKEALNNAAKHSGATELSLSIHRHGHGLIVALQDNGRGFDPAQPKTDRHGMDNMSQRMHEVGGQCRVTSQPGQGCRVEFQIPFVQMRRRFWMEKWRWGQRSSRSPAAISTKL
jgi:signal transduction histidine kinase